MGVNPKRVLQERIAQLLAQHGFYSKGKTCKDLRKDLCEDFQLRIRYEYSKLGKHFEVRPVIELINIPMEKIRSQQPDVEAYSPGMICFDYLKSIKEVDQLWDEQEADLITTDENDLQSLEHNALLIAQAISDFGLPHLKNYAKPAAAIELLAYMESIPHRRREGKKLYRLEVATGVTGNKLAMLRQIYQ